MFMNHKKNTTKQPHQIWSVVQVHHLTSCQASCWTDYKLKKVKYWGQDSPAGILNIYGSTLCCLFVFSCSCFVLSRHLSDSFLTQTSSVGHTSKIEVWSSFVSFLVKIFTPKISLVILLTVCHTILVMWVFAELGIGSTNNS